MADPVELETRRFGTDLYLGEKTNRGINGQAPTISGRENVRQWMIETATTRRRELVHRANRGADLLSYVGQLDRPTAQAALANDLRNAWLRDPRIADATVRVEPASTPGQVVLTVTVAFAGEQDAETFEAILNPGL